MGLSDVWFRRWVNNETVVDTNDVSSELVFRLKRVELMTHSKTSFIFPEEFLPNRCNIMLTKTRTFSFKFKFF